MSLGFHEEGVQGKGQATFRLTRDGDKDVVLVHFHFTPTQKPEEDLIQADLLDATYAPLGRRDHLLLGNDLMKLVILPHRVAPPSPAPLNVPVPEA